ncbi:MAG TPA: class I SAM-dependent methyltransferase [Actinomycetes bacterium]|nr:class I SAM-dependent methyltransferase [Actinomycetes bacterium]
MESTEQAVERVRRHFDEMVDAEWLRLAESIAGRVSFEVHRRFLAEHISHGMRVLEIGAGPGRFTRELAALGATITVTDLSEAQLAANRDRASADGFDAHVEEWRSLDIRDTSSLPANSFDAVVAYGGPLSYVFDHAEDALRGLLRLSRPDGVVVASVMSLLGAWRHFLPAILDFTDDQNDHILLTGDLRQAQPEGHVCQMYRASDLVRMVESAGGQLIAMSASNWASLDHLEALETLESQPERWARFLNHEVRACAEPGAWDGGTHVLFACR